MDAGPSRQETSDSKDPKGGSSVWVTRRTDYATRALIALALADGGPLKMSQIADVTEAPRSVLEQVMPPLRSAGLVRSERGPGGGYRLNRPADEITLERVVRLFEGQLAPIGYATRKNPDACPELVARSLLPVWEKVRDQTIATLEATTFADLARRARRPEPRRGARKS
jgi:Rrf2 family protein